MKKKEIKFFRDHPTFVDRFVDETLYETTTMNTRSSIEFECDKCDLGYSKLINRITKTQKTSCPHCGYKKRFCGKTSCAQCVKILILEDNAFEKAYVSGIKDDNYTKLSKKNNQTVIFYCQICNHRYRCKIQEFFYRRVNKNRSYILRKISNGCNHCTRKQTQCLKPCAVCFERTCGGNCFDNALYEWVDDKNKACETFLNSTTKINLRCLKCSHLVKITPHNIYNTNAESNCYYCSTFKRWKPCSDQGCEKCYRLSLESFIDNNSDKIELIDKKNGKLYQGTDQAITYKCLDCQTEHTQRVSILTRNDATYNCPVSTNVTEKIMGDELNVAFKEDEQIGIKYNTGFEWCKKINKLPFDFILNIHGKPKIAIELDGNQHFADNVFHSSKERFLKQQEHDEYKNLCAIKRGVHIIRVYQPDYLKNTGKVKQRFIALTKQIISRGASAKPVYTFLKTNNEKARNRYEEMATILRKNRYDCYESEKSILNQPLTIINNNITINNITNNNEAKKVVININAESSTKKQKKMTDYFK
ncbi:hypothetical protein OAB94_02440 [Flavobacteriaceae bacterium]|nr:hypothetical protein [Flavobacteriaceae bacterium]